MQNNPKRKTTNGVKRGYFSETPRGKRHQEVRLEVGSFTSSKLRHLVVATQHPHEGKHAVIDPDIRAAQERTLAKQSERSKAQSSTTYSREKADKADKAKAEKIKQTMEEAQRGIVYNIKKAGAASATTAGIFQPGKKTTLKYDSYISIYNTIEDLLTRYSIVLSPIKPDESDTSSDTLKESLLDTLNDLCQKSPGTQDVISEYIKNETSHDSLDDLINTGKIKKIRSLFNKLSTTPPEPEKEEAIADKTSLEASEKLVKGTTETNIKYFAHMFNGGNPWKGKEEKKQKVATLKA